VKALEEFRRQSPAVTLKLCTVSSAEVSNRVLSGDAMFGLRYRADSDRRIRCETVGQELMSVVCSPANPLAKLKSVPVSRLLDQTWIVWPLRPTDPEGGFQRVLASYGLRGRHAMVTDSTLLQKQLIESNFGIGLLSQRSVQAELRTGTLRTLNVTSMRSSIPVTLVQRRGGHAGAAAQRLMDMLVGAFTALAKNPAKAKGNH